MNQDRNISVSRIKRRWLRRLVIATTFPLLAVANVFLALWSVFWFSGYHAWKSNANLLKTGREQWR